MRFAIDKTIHGAFAADERITAATARCAYAETTGGHPGATELLGQLLRAAIDEVGEVAPAAWPAAVAVALDTRLRGRLDATPSIAPTSALFAAAALAADRVFVCTAGDLRVHLIEGDAVIARTRDHVYADDPPPAPVPGLDPAAVASVATRWLGGDRTAAPESVVWTARAPYRVAVCASQCHHHAAPDRYLPRLLGGGAAPADGWRWSSARWPTTTPCLRSGAPGSARSSTSGCRC